MMGETRKWNQPSTGHSAKGGAGAQPSRRRVALCVLLGASALSAGVAAWFYLRGDDVDNGQDNSTAPSRPAMIDEVKPAKPAKAAEAKKPGPPDPHAGMVLSSTGVWQPADRPYRPGRKKVHAVHTNRSNRARGTAPYISAAEQMLFSAFSTPLGIAPRPLPKLVGKDRAELVNALVSRNDATDKDPENLKIAKEILQRAKDEMRKFLKEGGEPDDFFRHYHDLQQTAYLKRLEAMKEIRRIAREEADPELARALRDKVNEGLKAEGIMPVHADISDNPEDN